MKTKVRAQTRYSMTVLRWLALTFAGAILAMAPIASAQDTAGISATFSKGAPIRLTPTGLFRPTSISATPTCIPAFRRMPAAGERG